MADGSSYYNVGPVQIDLVARAARYVKLGDREEKKKLREKYLAGLSDSDKQAVSKLVQAAQLMDELYLTQEWSDNIALKYNLDKKAEYNDDDLLLRYFNINQGPWDRLNENEPFVDGVAHRPAGANYYPTDLTKEEFDLWVSTLDSEDKLHATGYYHVIRRDHKTKTLKSVPYSEEYAQFLKPAAQHLRDAAKLVSDESLARFLSARADAFLSNEYDDSDRAWMDVARASPLEVTIGPYEVYGDTLFGYKASFEAFISVRDLDASEKLARFSDCMQELEDNLPIPDEDKNTLGANQPIVVVNLIYVAGDRAGPQTAAYNLPNNPVVIKDKGSKMVILKNVQEKKFNTILMRIADALILPEQRPLVAFDSFFTHILAHEMCHGLGPHTIKNAQGEVSSVSKELQEFHSAIEEAKADTTGLWALQYLIDNGKVDAEMEKSMYVTYLASQFRSLRFGLREAHGRGHALQMNKLMKCGAYDYDATTGYWSVNFGAIKDGVKQLTHEIMALQAKGDKNGAKDMLETWAISTPEMTSSLSKLSSLNIPVDIEAIRLW